MEKHIKVSGTLNVLETFFAQIVTFKKLFVILTKGRIYKKYAKAAPWLEFFRHIRCESAG